MSGQSAGAGFCKSPLSLVRRSTRSVRALASAEGGAFSGRIAGAATGRICRGPGSALRTTNLFFATARTANCRHRHLRLQQKQKAVRQPRLHLPVVNRERAGIVEDGVDQRAQHDLKAERDGAAFISWSGLDIGRDRSSPVSHYEAPFEFTGQLLRVTVDMHDDRSWTVRGRRGGAGKAVVSPLSGAGATATVIASEAKQSIVPQKEWIASSRSLSSGAHSRDPLAPRNDEFLSSCGGLQGAATLSSHTTRRSRPTASGW
jgi:hypothetical protein